MVTHNLEAWNQLFCSINLVEFPCLSLSKINLFSFHHVHIYIVYYITNYDDGPKSLPISKSKISIRDIATKGLISKVLTSQGCYCWSSYQVFECRSVHVIRLLIGFLYMDTFTIQVTFLTTQQVLPFSPLFKGKNNILIKISYQFPFAMLFSPHCLAFYSEHWVVSSIR